MDIQHKIAILVANGFHETALVSIQKLLRESDVKSQMVSSENGVVNGWADNTWGCFFPVDVAVNEALASDFSGVIIMGGDKSIQRLQKTAHTERFINSFLRAEKPMLALEHAKELILSEPSSMVIVDSNDEDLDANLTAFLDQVMALELPVDMDMAA